MFYNAGATGYENKRILSAYTSYYDNFNQRVEYFKIFNGNLQYEQPFKKDSRSSFGFMANYTNRYGFLRFRMISGTVAYSYKIVEHNNLSLRFGIQTGLKNIRNAYSFYNTQPERGAIGVVPFLNSGLFVNAKTFYGGFSVRSLFQPDIQTGLTRGYVIAYKQLPLLNFMLGNTFFADHNLNWNPNILFISHSKASVLHFNNTFIYKKKYSLGASYNAEWVNYASLNAGVKFGDKAELSGDFYIPIPDQQGYPSIKGGELCAKFNF
jgi:hypothetical protein